MILHGHGIRSSVEGQLGGGVSVCVSSLDSFGWDAFRPPMFRENVGRALWGTKWREVILGGPHANKLDVVLVVRVPTLKDETQFVPGRPEVYIIPDTSLDRTLGDGTDKRFFLSNKHVAACFLLQPPGSDGTNEQWIEDTGSQSLWDISIAEDQYTMTYHKRSTVLDTVNGDQKLQTISARIAQPADLKQLCKRQHKAEEDASQARELWIENVTRFTTAEMTASIASLWKQQLRFYSLAFYFASRDEAHGIIRRRGIPNSGHAADGSPCLTVCLTSPEELGWDSGGDVFRQRAGKYFFDDWRDNDPRTQVMFVLRVPSFVSRSSSFQLDTDETGRAVIPADLLVDDKDRQTTDQIDEMLVQSEKASVYPVAHILKCYGLQDESRTPTLKGTQRAPEALQKRLPAPLQLTVPPTSMAVETADRDTPARGLGVNQSTAAAAAATVHDSRTMDIETGAPSVLGLVEKTAANDGAVAAPIRRKPPGLDTMMRRKAPKGRNASTVLAGTPKDAPRKQKPPALHALQTRQQGRRGEVSREPAALNSLEAAQQRRRSSKRERSSTATKI